MDEKLEQLLKECQVERITASKKGGQNVNRRHTAIRLTHEPTGIRVHVETERSQARNLELAAEILAQRLAVLRTPRKPRRKTRVPAAARAAIRRAKAHRSGLKQSRQRPKSDD